MDKQELPKEITEQEVKRFYYDLNDFDTASPMAKGGMKDAFYTEVWPVAEWLMNSRNAALKQLEEARKEGYKQGVADQYKFQQMEICPLCGKVSDEGMPHKKCMDYESSRPSPPIERS